MSFQRALQGEATRISSTSNVIFIHQFDGVDAQILPRTNEKAMDLVTDLLWSTKAPENANNLPAGRRLDRSGLRLQRPLRPRSGQSRKPRRRFASASRPCR